MGDLNNDGMDDAIVGAPNADEINGNDGTVYVRFGPVLGDNDLTVDADVKIYSSPGDSKLGGHVWADDVNNDGADDLLVGALMADDATLSSEGAIYLFHGPLSGSMDPDNEYDSKMVGYHMNAVRTADFDGDGQRDYVMSRYEREFWNDGSVRVLFGPLAAGVQPAVGDIQMAPSGDNNRLGESITSGDFDGDGYADIAVSAPVALDSTGASVGAVFLLLNVSAKSGAISELDADVVIHGQEAGLGSTTLISISTRNGGSAIVGLDSNADGIDDLAIGNHVWGDGNGATYVITGPITTNMVVSDADAQIYASSRHGFGYALGAGDVDGDGADDLLIGSPPSNTRAGFLFLGGVP